MKSPTKCRFNREAVIEAAHTVAAKSGVDNITFRAISKASGIGLGTLTYHYRDRREIILEATEYSRKRFFRRFRSKLDDAKEYDELSSALASVIEHITSNCHDELVVDYDFYLTGLDTPGLLEFCEDWARETISMLLDYMPPTSATVVSYLLEGIFLHSAKFGHNFKASEIYPVLHHSMNKECQGL
jgi:AcrR family transcriptional regulator